MPIVRTMKRPLSHPGADTPGGSTQATCSDLYPSALNRVCMVCCRESLADNWISAIIDTQLRNKSYLSRAPIA